MNTKELDTFHLEDLKNDQHPSNYNEHHAYKLLLLRFPAEIVGDEIKLMTQGFVLTAKEVFLFDSLNHQLLPLTSGLASLYQLIDESVDKTLQMVNTYHEAIMDMEELLYSQKLEKDFLKKWFQLKKNLTVMNRVISRTAIVYESFYHKNEKELDGLIHHYSDIYEHLSRAKRYVEHDIEKLNTIYNFYSAMNNDKMNHSVYLLTLISAIFLPLNLLVGFFGMNTGNLPFTQEGGTLKVLFLLGTILCTLLLFFIIREKQ
jgi:magnesium transporter